MQNAIERMTTLGVESTSTFVDSTTLAQRQSAQFMQSWLKVLDANQQVSREIVTRLVQQSIEAGSAWQRFVLGTAQTFDPFATVSRLRQLQETVERLDALNQQVDANARRAETAARKAQAAIDALASVQQQVVDGATRAEAAADRAQQISGNLEQLDRQVRDGVKQGEAAVARVQQLSGNLKNVDAQVRDGVTRAEAAAQRAENAGRDAAKANEQVTASAQRIDAAVDRVQQLSGNRNGGVQKSKPDATSEHTPAPKRSRAASKAADNTPPQGEQTGDTSAPAGEKPGK
jgi:methyl-accepting chemotaxis protein